MTSQATRKCTASHPVREVDLADVLHLLDDLGVDPDLRDAILSQRSRVAAAWTLDARRAGAGCDCARGPPEIFSMLAGMRSFSKLRT
jgi:hypothetical protein